MITCPNCKGTGELYAPLSFKKEKKPCPTCNGVGKVSDNNSQWVKCPKCHGWGIQYPLKANRTCSVCKGIGITLPTQEATIMVRLGAVYADASFAILLCLLISLIICLSSGNNYVMSLMQLGYYCIPIYFLPAFLFTKIKGQTPGKLLFGIKVVNGVNDRPGTIGIALREIIKTFFGILATCFALALILFSLAVIVLRDKGEKGTFYDNFTNTYVVEAKLRQGTGRRIIWTRLAILSGCVLAVTYLWGQIFVAVFS
jgi:uncharacterized RDD family membrane protein YckC